MAASDKEKSGKTTVVETSGSSSGKAAPAVNLDDVGSPIGGVDADGGRTAGAKKPDAEGVSSGTPREAPVNDPDADDGAPLPSAPAVNRNPDAPLGSPENPIAVTTVDPGQPDGQRLGTPSPEDRIAETAQGNRADPAIAPSSEFQKNKTNVDLAPMPRDQIDEDYTIDPMKRDPGVAPDPRAAADALAEENDGTEEYVMTMPYWDGVQMHPKGSVLKFKPEDAPYLSKPVKAK